MSYQPKPVSKNAIKYTQIPLCIQTNPTLGIINFQTQKYETVLQKPFISLMPHQEEITFKSAVGRISDSQQSQNQVIPKKIIPYTRITIKPENIKKKYFRVDIPVNKGPTGGVKNTRERINFVIQYGNENRGTLTLLDDLYECVMEITNAENQLSIQEKIKLQDARNDARRREEKIQIIQEKKDGRKKEK